MKEQFHLMYEGSLQQQIPGLSRGFATLTTAFHNGARLWSARDQLLISATYISSATGQMTKSHYG